MRIGEWVLATACVRFGEACDIGQSHYLGRPSPIDTFSDLTGVTAPVIDDNTAREPDSSIPMLEIPLLRSV